MRQFGLLVIGHVHNRAYKNFSAGSAVTAEEMAALFPDAVLYDDAELTQALIRRGRRFRRCRKHLWTGKRLAVASGPDLSQPAEIHGSMALPPPGAKLRRNPLYDTAEG